MCEIEYVLGVTLILHRSGVNPVPAEERPSQPTPNRHAELRSLYAKAHADLLHRIGSGLPLSGYLTGEIDASAMKAKWSCLIGAEEHYAPPYEASTFSTARMGLYLIRE